MNKYWAYSTVLSVIQLIIGLIIFAVFKITSPADILEKIIFLTIGITIFSQMPQPQSSSRNKYQVFVGSISIFGQTAALCSLYYISGSELIWMGLMLSSFVLIGIVYWKLYLYTKEDGDDYNFFGVFVSSLPLGIGMLIGLMFFFTKRDIVYF